MDGRGLNDQEKTLDIYTTYLYQRHPQNIKQYPVCNKVLKKFLTRKTRDDLYSLLFGRGARFRYCVGQKHELFCWPRLIGVHHLRIS